MATDTGERMVNELIWAVRQDERAQDHGLGADRRYTRAELETAQRNLIVLIEKLHVAAKNASHALMSFTPGGSEYFTQVRVGDWEDYYADADACQKRVRERITRAEEDARARYRAEIDRINRATDAEINAATAR